MIRIMKNLNLQLVLRAIKPKEVFVGILENLDIITDGYGDYISLEASIDSFEADGFKCVTTDYGSGVLYNK